MSTSKLQRHGLLGAALVCFALPLGLELVGHRGRGRAAAMVGPHDPGARQVMGPVQRALGPISSGLASAQWVRFQRALQRGETARAYDIAEGALALDGRSSRGWMSLAQHLIFERGSFLENDDPRDRRRWIQAGLDVLLRGEEVARDPGDLAYFSGTIRFVYLADLPEEDLQWPQGPDALRAAGLADLRRAAAAGSRDAAETLTAIERDYGGINGETNQSK